MIIRSPQSEDYSQWKRLWLAYVEFYESSVTQETTETLWQRIMDSEHPINCFLAQSDEGVFGLVHYFPHLDTWSPAPIGYLADLFVDPQAREKGTGEALIDAVCEYGRQQQWSAIYWKTKEDNKRARGLYDKVTGGCSGFITYKHPLT